MFWWVGMKGWVLWRRAVGQSKRSSEESGQV
jgi:hypothetical protein